MTALEHGGNLAEAGRRHGHPPQAWLDLSTGIAPWAWPVPALPAAAWHHLPDGDAALVAAAQACYGAGPLLPVAGSVAAIRALPTVLQRWHPRARVIVAPLSFNEHAAAWSRAGHAVRTVAWDDFDAEVDHCDVAIVCHPNNPTADDAEPARLLGWRERLAARGGWLVVDEAFRDTRPERSVIGAAGQPGLVVLRSLGKFFGLAGARVGFVAGRPMLLDLLAAALGPWCVAGPSAAVATAALHDTAWQQAQRQRLIAASQRLAALLAGHGLPVSHSDFFAWTDTPAAAALHEGLAAHHAIWTRRFDEAQRVSLRFGLPGEEAAWRRLDRALQDVLQ